MGLVIVNKLNSYFAALQINFLKPFIWWSWK